MMKLLHSFLLLPLVFPSLSRACEPLLQRFSFECQVQDEYQKIKNDFDSLGVVDVESLIESRVLRFIDHSAWKKNKNMGQYLPWLVYEPAPQTWMFWEKGYRHSLSLIRDEASVEVFSLDDINSLHRQSISARLMTLASLLKGNYPGKMRSWAVLRPPEFSAPCSWELGEKEKHLIEKFDLKGSDGSPLVRGSTKLCPDGIHYQAHVLYLQSHKVKREMRLWLTELKSYLKGYFQGDLSIPSPYAAVAYFQRKFVSIHPYGDGNGRVSRFLQDQILRLLRLPSPVSADLMEDILTPQEEYAELFKVSVQNHLKIFSQCLSERKNASVSPECRSIQGDIFDDQMTALAKEEFQDRLTDFIYCEGKKCEQP